MFVATIACSMDDLVSLILGGRLPYEMPRINAAKMAIAADMRSMVLNGRRQAVRFDANQSRYELAFSVAL